MCNYISYLKQVYPQGAHFSALLPKTTYNCSYDLSDFGYECLGKIGEGALSTVYKVKEKKTNQIYACKLTSLKHINGGHCPASFVAERALQEITLMLKLQKAGVKGIMPLCGYFPSYDTIKTYVHSYKYIPKFMIPESSIILEIMPLAVPFRCFMEERFRKRQKLTVEQACAIFMDILSPIEYMHGKTSVIHRDIKVDNLMLVKHSNGTVRVAISDFNISKEFYGNYDSRYTPIGTPGYHNHRIKEKAINREQVSRADAEKQDLYAAAQCMYILLNRDVMAPNKGKIEKPLDSPSDEFTALLISLLNPDIERVPDCATVKKRLESMINRGNLATLATKNNTTGQKQAYDLEKKVKLGYIRSKNRHNSRNNSSNKPFYPKGHF